MVSHLWNATSVRNKAAELHKFLTHKNTAIAIIIETWLSPNPENLKLYLTVETPN